MFSHLLASLGLLAAASDPPRPKHFDCGTNIVHASRDFLQTIRPLHGKPNTGSPAVRAALAGHNKITGPIAVDAVFHILAKTANKDSVTNNMPSAQIDALNEANKPYDISYNLINVTWTTNDAWAVGAKPDDDEMKKMLQQAAFWGRCTLPSALANGKPDPTGYFNDGCKINPATIPAGSFNGYNAGKIAVHETGRWMGLLHTFEGFSCDVPGDYIDNTPVESVATVRCSKNLVKRGRPDIQKLEESDPIHNYIDYSMDACYGGFTALQVGRMKSMLGLYRDRN